MFQSPLTHTMCTPAQTFWRGVLTLSLSEDTRPENVRSINLNPALIARPWQTLALCKTLDLVVSFGETKALATGRKTAHLTR